MRSAVIRRDLPEPHEGRHLVLVAPHRLHEIARARQVGVGGVLHQPPVCGDALEQAVEQVEPAGIAVQETGFGKLDEASRNVGGGGVRNLWRRLRFSLEQIAVVLRAAPVDRKRRDAFGEKPARRAPPADDIVGPVEDDPPPAHSASAI